MVANPPFIHHLQSSWIDPGHRYPYQKHTNYPWLQWQKYTDAWQCVKIPLHMLEYLMNPTGLFNKCFILVRVTVDLQTIPGTLVALPSCHCWVPMNKALHSLCYTTQQHAYIILVMFINAFLQLPKYSCKFGLIHILTCPHPLISIAFLGSLSRCGSIAVMTGHNTYCEDNTGFHSSQPRTGIWGYSQHRFTGQLMVGNMSNVCTVLWTCAHCSLSFLLLADSRWTRCVLLFL